MAEYIAVLFLDCGYHESSQRRGWLRARFDKAYPDELTPGEQHEAIKILREEKYGPEEI